VGKTVFGNSINQVAFETGTMTATGNANVSGTLNLTGILNCSNNVFATGSINATGGMFTNTLRTPTITVDNLSIRPSAANNNLFYSFNERGEINASSVTIDNDSRFIKQVTALGFKTSLAFPGDQTSTLFSVTNGGFLTCNGFFATASDNSHEFGTDASKKVLIKSGTIETRSESANLFGPEGKRVTLTSGSISATGTVVSTSNSPNTFGATEAGGWVKLEQGKITANSAGPHIFGNGDAKIRINNGEIICNSNGPHLFGSNNLFEPSSSYVKIDNGEITATGLISTSGGLSGAGITATGHIAANSTLTATGLITANGGLSGAGITATGHIAANSTLTATGLITANGGLSGAGITASGHVAANSTLTAAGLITANAGVSSTTTITANSFNATSDKRVKAKIEDLDAKHSLCLLRALQPKRYDFTNKKDKGRIGFIAQDIQRIGLPVHKSKGIIGNIQQDVVCNEGWFRTEFPLHIGDIVKLGEKTHEIVEYKEGMFRIEEHLTGIYSLYGIEVDDFLSIEPNAIFTVAVSALQAMDEQMKEQQKQIKFLIQVVGTVLFFSLGASIYVLLK
jgi:hypothetical protein